MSRVFKYSPPTRNMIRRNRDITNLRIKNFKVLTFGDNLDNFHVIFHGPDNTPYKGGVWKINVELPTNYPINSPSVGFVNKIYHPNIDERSGTICLDVLNESWTPSYDLPNVFEMFIPELLANPNTEDPLNAEAANLKKDDPAAYERKVKEYCETYAKPEDILPVEETATVSVEETVIVDDEKTTEDEKGSDDDKPYTVTFPSEEETEAVADEETEIVSDEETVVIVDDENISEDEKNSDDDKAEGGAA